MKETLDFLDAHSIGQKWIHLLPYVKPATVRHAYPQEDIQTYQNAVQAAVRHMEVDTG